MTWSVGAQRLQPYAGLQDSDMHKDTEDLLPMFFTSLQFTTIKASIVTIAKTSIAILQVTTNYYQKASVFSQQQLTLAASLYFSITNYCRITTSKAANTLINNYIHAGLFFLYIYKKILPVPSAPQTDPSSGANQTHLRNGASQQWMKSHLDDELHHGAGVSPVSLLRVHSAKEMSWGTGVHVQERGCILGKTSFFYHRDIQGRKTPPPRTVNRCC